MIARQTSVPLHINQIKGTIFMHILAIQYNNFNLKKKTFLLHKFHVVIATSIKYKQAEVKTVHS